jgi:hypothetical protein
VEFLKDSLKYLGFGDKLNTELENKIKETPAAFQLPITGEYTNGNKKETVNYVLDFKKSDQSDMYFFNKYQATMQADSNAEAKSQTFYITKNSGITSKEAFNLLSGRAVHKELMNAEDKPYKAWLQLDFNEKDKNNNFKVKQFHEAYGFNLDTTVAKYPIKELNIAEEKERLMKSLSKGNVHPVTFVKNGQEEKMFVEANPQYKALTVYDANMTRQFQGNEKKEEQSSRQEKKEKVSQEKSDDSESNPAKRSKRRGVRV